MNLIGYGISVYCELEITSHINMRAASKGH